MYGECPDEWQEQTGRPAILTPYNTRSSGTAAKLHCQWPGIFPTFTRKAKSKSPIYTQAPESCSSTAVDKARDGYDMIKRREKSLCRVATYLQARGYWHVGSPSRIHRSRCQQQQRQQRTSFRHGPHGPVATMMCGVVLYEMGCVTRLTGAVTAAGPRDEFLLLGLCAGMSVICFHVRRTFRCGPSCVRRIWCSQSRWTRLSFHFRWRKAGLVSLPMA